MAWCLSKEGEINEFSQYSHLYGFSTLCTLQRCLIRSRFFKNDSGHSKTGFQIDTDQVALLANQIAAFGKSTNQMLSSKHQFENQPKHLCGFSPK